MSRMIFDNAGFLGRNENATRIVDYVSDFEDVYKRIDKTICDARDAVEQSEFNIGSISYTTQKEEIQILFENLCDLLQITHYIYYNELRLVEDENFNKKINNESMETFEKVKMDDITVNPETVDLSRSFFDPTTDPDTGDVSYVKRVYEGDEWNSNFSLSDFLGFDAWDSERGGVKVVDGFTDILYDPFLTDDESIEEFLNNNKDGLRDLVEGGDFTNKKIQPLRDFIAEVLEAGSLGTVPLIEGVVGFDVIRWEDLSELDCRDYMLEGAIAFTIAGTGVAKGERVIKLVIEESSSTAVSEVTSRFVLKTGTDKWKADLAGLFAANILKVDADALLKKAKDLDAKAPNSKVSAVDDITDTKKNNPDVAEDSSGGGLAKPKKVEDGNNKKLPPLESGLNSVDDIIKGVENGDVPLSNNIQKGNYGEMKMDAYFESQGYERISLDRVTDLNTPTHQGIDGVYYNPDGHPPYIIGEAKYGSSRLSTLADGTPQMSTEWIEGGKGTPRLELSVGKNVADDILLEGYDSVLVNIDKDGNIITHMLDKNGQIVK